MNIVCKNAEYFSNKYVTVYDNKMGWILIDILHNRSMCNMLVSQFVFHCTSLCVSIRSVY